MPGWGPGAVPLTQLRLLALLAVGLSATAYLPSASAQTKPTIAARVNATRYQPKLPASRVDDVLLTVKASVIYTPVARFAGDMEFAYTVADRWGASATGTVVVKVGTAYLVLDDDPTPGACGGAGAVGLMMPVAGLFGLTGLMRRRSLRR